jgi:hypothetical protein
MTLRIDSLLNIKEFTFPLNINETMISLNIMESIIRFNNSDLQFSSI